MNARRTIRIAAALIGPILLAVVIFVAFGRLGFNPTDDGNLLAQSYRILDGQVPHRDIIFARPMGSALLHVIDFAVPLPLFEAARFMGILAIVLYSMFFAWLIYGRPPTKWDVPHLAGAVTSTFVNMHGFPPMAWYTTDGLLFVAIGFVMLRTGLERKRPILLYAGMLALGAAPLMKQSFALAPLLGLIWVYRRAPEGGRSLLRPTLVRAAISGAFPVLVYIGAIAALGGLDEFVYQVTHARVVWGGVFTAVLYERPLRVSSWVLIAALAVGAAVLRRRRSHARSPGSGLDLVIRLAVSAFIVTIPIWFNLEFLGAWAVQLTWCLVVWLVVHERMRDPVGWLIAAIAWMTALSWGVTVPNLVAGTIVLFLVHRVWRNHQSSGAASERRVLAAAIAAAVGLTGLAFSFTRVKAPYADRPASELTADLQRVSARFGAIRTSPLTARYMEEMASCIRRYPARRVAVLPDNPGIYPALELANPFPIDWMLQAEVENEEERILSAARRLARLSDYLVLFQTFGAYSFKNKDRIAPATEASEPFFYGSALGREIFDTLGGERISCGPFIGRYSPAR